jgi:hypothetical protein
MKRLLVASRSLPLLMPLIVCWQVAAAAPNKHEKWIIGRWISHTEGRPDRTIVFHADHSWGVEYYDPSGPNEQLTIREDIRGRRWHLAGDRLVLRAPSDDGFETFAEKIVSFRHDELVTDISTYTREK